VIFFCQNNVWALVFGIATLLTVIIGLLPRESKYTCTRSTYMPTLLMYLCNKTDSVHSFDEEYLKLRTSAVFPSHRCAIVIQ
jgi:hypothetical protein